ncbi:AI-2E family transporter [Oxalobacteraceae bacterium CAVE-383]|nr:AI-2E family transporter [Oxalobacteraceae bacterium CAVE-383]
MRHPKYQTWRSQSGSPLWTLVTMAITCLTLLLFKASLWLAVPLLLALVLYYLLRPGYLWLTRAGMRPGLASGTMIAGVILAAILAGFLSLPAISAFLSQDHALVDRYIAGGLRLLHGLARASDLSLAKFAPIDLAGKLDREIIYLKAHLGQIVWLGIAAMSRWAPTMILVPFFTFFLLKDGQKLNLLFTRTVPNAFFESWLVLLDDIDGTAKAYFRGLFQLTVIDACILSAGMGMIGFPAPVLLGSIIAVLMWIPYLGSLVGGLGACMFAITEFPDRPQFLYCTIILFLSVRWLDGLVFMPMTIGKSLHIHPVVAVLMILLGGSLAGIPGMMLVLPVYGILKVIFDSAGFILFDARLLARYRHRKFLRRREAMAGLSPPD